MRTLLSLLMLWSLPLPAAVPGDAPWLLVDTEADKVFVMAGEDVVDTFAGIAIGRGGAQAVHYAGDHTTPRGSYRVSRVNPRSKFNIFIGVDYPTVEHARLAFGAGRISEESYLRIAEAARLGKPAPQNTELGGAIGIHGVGRGSMRVHSELNWTQGCIALTNPQIARLVRYVWIGMRVEIR